MPVSALYGFGREFMCQKWNFLDSYDCPTEMAKAFEMKMKLYVDKHFPLKKVIVSPFDKP